MTNKNKLIIGSTHKLSFVPGVGDVRRSDCYCTIRAVSSAGPMVQITGKPTMQVSWEQWEDMLNGTHQ